MKDMTQGNIFKHLSFFAIPLILGNMFQLTYNAVDSIIIGRYSGKAGLAALGIANPIMNIMIFLIVGICLGAGVLMSEFYGAARYDKLKHEISTIMTLGLVFTVFISILCFVFVRPILALTRTPKDLISSSALYLRIVILGMVFCFLYNIFATALRATGDSKTPIICVAISAVFNCILDFILVAKFDMGICGAAFATVLSQFLSCLFIIIYVYTKQPLLQIKKKEFVIDASLVKITLGYSTTTAMQQTVLYVGKAIVQSAVNPLGLSSIASFNAGTKIDDFAYQPGQSIGHAMTTLVAQNHGAGKKDRMKGGFYYGLLLELSYGFFIFVATLISRKFLIGLFVSNDETTVLEMGQEYLRLMACFYILPCITNGIQGFMRGTGDMKVTLISTATQMFARCLFSYLLSPFFGLFGIAAACFFGWLCMLIYEVPTLLSKYGSLLKKQK